MHKHLALLGLLLCTTAQARTLTPHDLVTLDRISDPHVSPDGKTVAYDLRSTDYDANKGRHAIWVVVAGGEHRLEGDASNPRWSPDGAALYFLSSRAGGNQIWRVGLGAEDKPVQVTKLPVDVGTFRIAPDGKTIILSAAVFPDCDTLDLHQIPPGRARRTKAPAGTLYDQTVHPPLG